MAETSFQEFIVPGVFIRVRAEGLIRAGGIPTGNIGIVGTAPATFIDDDQKDVEDQKEVKVDFDATYVLSDYGSARAAFGPYDQLSAGTLNLTRGIEQLFRNGARTVFARALNPAATPAPGQSDYTSQFEELVKDNVNILVAPELSTDDAKAVLGPLLVSGEGTGRDMIAVIGSDVDPATTEAAKDIRDQVTTSPRMILVTPGIRAFDSAAPSREEAEVTLSGTYTAAAVAGLLATLAPQSSPTNKVLAGVTQLAHRFSYGQISQLVQEQEKGQVLVLEDRGGIRVVRGMTTDNGAFRQITTRRIVDFAKAGIRQVSNPFIGRLNNGRVRAALQGAIDGFLTTMKQNEALIDYTLQVTATRDDEIAGRVIVTAMLQPTFSIDFIAVTLVLQ